MACGSIVSVILIRALTTVLRVPGWEQDPTIVWIPDAGVGPAASFVLDALICVAAAAIAFASPPADRWWDRVAPLAILAGVVGVLLHALVLTPAIAVGGSPITRGDDGSFRLGSAWGAAVLGAWALREGVRADLALRRAVTLVLLGVVVPLAVKGMSQVLVEHPRMVESFEATRESWLAANAWEPGSASARLFERRLRQPEATGWFGLANVFGAVAAGALVAWGVIAVNGAALARTGAVRPRLAGAPTLAALASAGALLASGSKAAIVGAGAILLLLTLSRFAPMVAAATRRASGWIGPALVGGVLGAVVLRGAMGERLGELSVYFRWQYLVGATRVFVEHLPFGVGPDHFKDAYLLAKPPTSPEEVESPHALPADWLATLGLLAIPWLLVWFDWIRRAGRTAFAPLASSKPAPEPPDPRTRLFALCVVGVGTLASLLAEAPVVTPAWPIVMAASGVGWFVLVRAADAVLRAAPERALSVALAGGALVGAVLASFDVAPVHPHSAGWLFAIWALAASAAGAEPDRRAGARFRAVVPAAALLLAGAIVLGGVIPALRWEGHLLRAAGLSLITTQPAGHDAPQRLSDRPRLPDALDELKEAAGHFPDQPTPLDRSVGLRLRLAVERAEFDPSAARALVDGAIADLEGVAQRFPRSAQRWARLAAAREARAAILGDPGVLDEAVDAWARVAALDPHSLTPPLRAARAAAAVDHPDAPAWAAQALRADANLRLDPLRRLSSEDRAWLQRLAVSAPSDP
ncbi:MAG TPA: hypothetical protein DEB06_06750 [Phycisphaerales bacterium]|nr:hypothetical protein [Phycisphaerales bacterium]